MQRPILQPPTQTIPMSTQISRRYFLSECGIGLGKIAAASLLTQNLGARSLAPKPPLQNPKAKAVIHLFMAGAPSQLELFDPKPQLTKLEGSPLPKSIIGDQRYAFIQPDAAVLGPQFAFQQYGETRATPNSPAEPPWRSLLLPLSSSLSHES